MPVEERMREEQIRRSGEQCARLSAALREASGWQQRTHGLWRLARRHRQCRQTRQEVGDAINEIMAQRTEIIWRQI